MTHPSSSFADHVRAERQAVDEALDRFLPAPPDCPEDISTAMRYSLFAGGKRFRPVLTLAAAEAVVADPSLQVEADPPVSPDDGRRLALPAACAIEMIHTYSLIHDDLPAMDNDTLRRGRPTLHVVHGEGMAILAGDGLLTEAFALLGREPDSTRPGVTARRLRTIAEIGRAAGAMGMVGGQAIDLAAAGAAARENACSAFDLDALRRMHAAKTGALIRASAVSGAIMAGGTDPAVAAIGDYAVHVGLAFQIVDDILDVEGATEQLGKTAGKDAASGKPTYPSLVGLDRSKALARQAFDEAVAALGRIGIGRGRLLEIAEWVTRRTS